MNPEYREHAYARTIFKELERHLLDRFISVDAPAKADLLCEEVYYADRKVTQEALRAMLVRIRRMGEQAALQMSEFETTRRRQQSDEPPKEVTNESKGAEKQRKRKETPE
jgi:hypothetical protein